MKHLIRRLSRVADSSQQLLRPKTAKNRRSSASAGDPDLRQRRGLIDVPEGHLPVYVGEEMERFVVPADLLSRPIFAELLRQSAQEYGYEQRGVLRIPCPVPLFERVLDLLLSSRRVGADADADAGGIVEELARSFPEDMAIYS